MSFLSQIEEAVSRGFPEKSFVKLEESESSSFGDAHAVFGTGDARLRFVRDRGDVSLEVGSVNHSEWWPIDFICEMVERPFPGRDLPTNLAALKALLPDICRDFAAENYAATLKRLEVVRLRRRAKALEQWK
jgi:hypothetical protein